MTTSQTFDTVADLQSRDTRRVTATLDAEGRILATHARWEDAAAGAPAIFQVSIGDNLIQRWRELAGAGDEQVTRVLAAIEALLDGAELPVEFEYAVPGHPTPYWFLIEATPLRGEGGAIFLSWSDITLRRQTEIVLRSVARVAAEVREGVAVTDIDGTILYVDDGWARMHGYEPEDLHGQPITVVHPHPPTENPFIAFRDEVIEREVYRIEDRHQRKDGSLFHVEVRAALLRDDEGTPAGFTTIARDVSERKLAEEALRESESRLRHAEERQRMLAEAGAVLAGALAAEQALEAVARLAVPLLGDWCRAYLLEERGDVRCIAHGGVGQMDDLPDAAASGERAAQVVRNGAPLLANDCAAMGQSLLIVPLAAHGAVLGALALGLMCAERRYGAEDLTLAQDLANRAAMAVSAARLHQEAIRQREALQQFVEQLIAAQEEERRRIAYDLHDGLAQVLVANHQQLQVYAAQYTPRNPAAREQLEVVLSIAQLAVREVRRVVAGLRPTVLDDLGLSAALRQEARRLQELGWEVSFSDRLGARRLSPAVETALFRVGQEAITNAGKHSGSRRLHLALSARGTLVRLEVRDWGRGFSASRTMTTTGPGERVGLAGMKERTRLLNGRLTVRSRPGHGTRVIAHVPVKGV